MADTGTAKDLVQLIRDNPGCYAEIDNDYWTLYKSDPSDADVPDDDGWDKWSRENELASSTRDKIKPLGDGGYGSGNCYGGDILQALAKIVGMKVGSV